MQDRRSSLRLGACRYAQQSGRLSFLAVAESRAHSANTTGGKSRGVRSCGRLTGNSEVMQMLAGGADNRSFPFTQTVRARKYDRAPGGRPSFNWLGSRSPQGVNT